MKRYIKSFTTDQLKAQLGDNYPKGGYLYIFKHGIGPGTIPDDVKVVKMKDLPNYYTAVWLDRFLTTDELKQYDIPDETRINDYLGRIGYCQKDGDVVPCDDIVESSTEIKATTKAPKFETLRDDDGVYGYKLGNWYLMKIYYWGNNYTWYVLSTPEIYLSTYEKSQMHHVSGDNDQGYVSNLKEGKQILLDRYQKEFGDGVQACGDINCSTKISAASNYDTKLIAKWLKAKFDDEAFGTAYTMHRISDADAYMGRNGLTYNRRNNTIDLWKSGGDEDIPVYKVVPQYSSTKKQGTYAPKMPKLIPIDEWNATHNIDACSSVTSSTNDSSIVNKIYSVMMDYEYGYDPDMTDINAMLQELTNKGVHVDTSDAFKAAWVSAHNKAERKTWGDSGDSYQYDSLTPRELETIENYDTEYWEYVKDHPFNLKPASIKSSTDTKYFANMVNASDDDSIVNGPKYTASSYYGNNYSGLEDNFSTDDPSELVDWIWEHAANGGYIEVDGPKNRIRLDPDDLAERVESGDIGEHEIISQIDYL